MTHLLIWRQRMCKRKQHIHIKYDGAGFIPLGMLMKKKTV